MHAKPIFDTHFHIIDVVNALTQLAQANPECLMFGTDLPSQRAARPFLPSDIDLIEDTIGERLVERVFWRNAVEFYRPKVTASA